MGYHLWIGTTLGTGLPPRPPPDIDLGRQSNPLNRGKLSTFISSILHHFTCCRLLVYLNKQVYNSVLLPHVIDDDIRVAAEKLHWLH